MAWRGFAGTRTAGYLLPIQGASSAHLVGTTSSIARARASLAPGPYRGYHLLPAAYQFRTASFPNDVA
jgi:hypothetical protein